MSLIYVCDGSFENALCAVHRAYYSHETPDRIVCEKNLQTQMFANYAVIENDKSKAEAVFNSISKKISKYAEQIVYNVYLSDREDKEEIIYHFLVLGYKVGAKVVNYLTDEWVLKAVKISKSVSHEVNRMCGFVRFSSADERILFAKIAPTYNILAPISNYFSDRLKNLPWIIFDEKRNIASVYDTKKWEIFHCELKENKSFQRKDIYEELWVDFYNAVAIDARRNEKLRNQNMPKKYHKNILEMKNAKVWQAE